MPPRMLFLDFDGVLHPGSGVDSGFLCRAPDLEEALSGHDLRIVVSSSWRFHIEMDEILGMLPPGLAQRVVGATGDAHIGRWPRFHEIRACVQVNEPLANWRALDDARLEFPDPCPELIACDPRTGFGSEQAGSLRRWLRARG
jgi:hypothetical protein